MKTCVRCELELPNEMFRFCKIKNMCKPCYGRLGKAKEEEFKHLALPPKVREAVEILRSEAAILANYDSKKRLRFTDFLSYSDSEPAIIHFIYEQKLKNSYQ